MNHPHLHKLSGHVSDVKARLQTIVELPEDRLRRKPGSKSWSACEVAEHLLITNEAYLRELAPVLDSADRSNTDAPYKPGLFARIFIKFVSPDPKIKVKTVATAVPQEGTADVESIRRLIAQQDELAAALDRADEVNINKTKITSPLNSLVKFTIGEALTVLVMHQLRHLGQMERAVGAGSG